MRFNHTTFWTAAALAVGLCAAAGAQPPNVDAVLAACPSAAALDRVDADFAVVTLDDPTAGEWVCTAAAGSRDLTRLQERVYQAVLIMRRLAFDQPLPWTQQPLYDWFVGAVEGVRLSGGFALSTCCTEGMINLKADNLAALTTPRWVDPATGVGLLGLVAVLVHEARHNEGFPHTCGADDQTLAELGAWGVQHHLLRLLGDHADPDFFDVPDLPPGHYAGVARAQAENILKTRICSSNGEAPDAVVEVLAGPDGQVDDAEIARAVRWWIAGARVPGAGGRTLDDATMLALVRLWVTGARLERRP